MHDHLDPETLEQYVLGRLTDENRREVEEHTTTCGVCKAALETELRIAAGAKRLGREHAKARLRRRIGAERVFPWTRYAAVAAFLVILLSVVILNRWFATHEEPATSSVALQQKRDMPREQPQTLVATPRAEDRKNEVGRESNHREAEERSKQAKEPALELADKVAAGGSEGKALSRADERAAAPAMKGAEAQFAVEPGYWTEGFAEAPPPAGKMDRNAIAAQESDFMKSKKESGYVESSKDQQNIILTQRRAGELPISQQRQQRGGVPAYIEESRGSTHITLYLDSLVDPATLGAAQVERRGADTLIVKLRQKNIIYQLPQGRPITH
jgi:hypothetical protein